MPPRNGVIKGYSPPPHSLCHTHTPAPPSSRLCSGQYFIGGALFTLLIEGSQEREGLPGFLCRLASFMLLLMYLFPVATLLSIKDVLSWQEPVKKFTVSHSVE